MRPLQGRALHYFPSQQQGQGEGQGQQGEGPQQGQDDSQQAADQDARKGQSQGQGQGLSSPQAAEAKKAQQQQQQGALSKTGAAASAQQELDHSGTWCGWHTDHGSLTGLTCVSSCGIAWPCCSLCELRDQDALITFLHKTLTYLLS